MAEDHREKQKSPLTRLSLSLSVRPYGKIIYNFDNGQLELL